MTPVGFRLRTETGMSAIDSLGLLDTLAERTNNCTDGDVVTRPFQREDILYLGHSESMGRTRVAGNNVAQRFGAGDCDGGPPNPIPCMRLSHFKKTKAGRNNDLKSNRT